MLQICAIFVDVKSKRMPEYPFFTYLCVYIHIKFKHRQDQCTVIDQLDLICVTEEKQC